MNKKPTMWIFGVAALALAAVLSGCDKDASTAAADKADLTILATTDLKDVQWLEQEAKQATGVSVAFKFGSTMGSIESVAAGKSGADAAWFANAKWLLSDPEGAKKVLRQEKIASTPLVVGVCPETAAELGWTSDSKVTWRQIAEAAGSGKLRYAMSNPVSSNQGFMAVTGVAAAFSGKSEALSVEDVDAKAARAFFAGYKGVGDNSTYLQAKFIEGQCQSLNAFVNYESWLMGLNRSGELKAPLVLVYPHEGVSTADYPFMLLDRSKESQWQKVVDWLRSPAIQKKLAEKTYRRPVLAEAAKDPAVAELFKKKDMVELTFTSDRKVAEALMDAYLNEFRRPLASAFVLDVSGSMGGEGMASLVKAIDYLAGVDQSLAGRLAKLSARERVWMVPFSDEVGSPVLMEIGDGKAKAQSLDRIKAYAHGLSAGGGTRLYDAALEGLRKADEEAAKNPGASVSVVLFTDGAANKGMDSGEFERVWSSLPERQKKIPIFSILYGSGNAKELERVAKISGGRAFDARKEELSSVFRQIRAYQ